MTRDPAFPRTPLAITGLIGVSCIISFYARSAEPRSVQELGIIEDFARAQASTKVSAKRSRSASLKTMGWRSTPFRDQRLEKCEAKLRRLLRSEFPRATTW